MTTAAFGAAPKLAPSISLEIEDELYVIESPSTRVALKYAKLVNLASQKASGRDISAAAATKLLLDDDQEQLMVEELLGGTLDTMKANGVPWPYVQHAAMTVMLWTTWGVDAARAFWTQAGPKRKTAAKRSPKASRRTR